MKKGKITASSTRPPEQVLESLPHTTPSHTASTLKLLIHKFWLGGNALELPTVRFLLSTHCHMPSNGLVRARLQYFDLNAWAPVFGYAACF